MKKTITLFCLTALMILAGENSILAQCSGSDSLTYGFNDPNGAGTYSGFLCGSIDSVGTVGPYGYYDGDCYSIKLVIGTQVIFSIDSCNNVPVSLTINDSLYNIIPGAYSAPACSNTLNFTAPYTGEYFLVINQNGVCNNAGTTLLGQAYVKIQTGTTIPVCPDANVTNDTICGAIPLHIDSPYVQGNSSLAYLTDPIDGYITSIGYTCSPPNNTLWYSFTATTPIDTLYIRLTSDVGSNFHSWLVVFTSSFSVDPCKNSLTFLGCADGPNDNIGIDSVDIPLFGILAGHTYYFMIDGYNGATGGFSIALQSSVLYNSTEELNVRKNIFVYPNPADQTIRINSEILTESVLTITDLMGKEIFKRNHSFLNDEEINISQLIPGLYFVVVSNSKGVFKNTFIKY
jgi:hypothetical protein